MVKKGAISLHASFSILVGIWSGPFAFVGSRFFSNVQTPFSVILSWSIDGTEEFPSHWRDPRGLVTGKYNSYIQERRP
jgi:hypothetical protein